MESSIKWGYPKTDVLEWTILMAKAIRSPLLRFPFCHEGSPVVSHDQMRTGTPMTKRKPPYCPGPFT